MAEKGYMFLLGLFFKNWGLKRLLLDNSLEIVSKIGIIIRMYSGIYVVYLIVSKG
jgi:hypothetical protein